MQLPARIQRTDLFNIRDHPAIFKHDVDADLSHNAIPLRRIYALNNGNKADDLVQSWSPSAMADVTGVSSAGSDTAGQRTAGRALPDGSRVLVA
ncbi:hypothetical protein [Mesorhizobium sp.]|uniref:hypothetical protein n=1 Tax=Mesorhizobium sp. TaxID=1871066 RepID=UPI0025BAFD43|nr:hypothetical protein [Mesorhizobium sp.]